METNVCKWPGDFSGGERVRVGQRFGVVASLPKDSAVDLNIRRELVPIAFDDGLGVEWVGHPCIFHRSKEGDRLDSQFSTRVPYERSPGLSSRVRRAMRKYSGINQAEYITLAIEEKLLLDGIPPLTQKINEKGSQN